MRRLTIMGVVAAGAGIFCVIGCAAAIEAVLIGVDIWFQIPYSLQTSVESRLVSELRYQSCMVSNTN
jgi:hypothetical protein